MCVVVQVYKEEKKVILKYATSGAQSIETLSWGESCDKGWI